MRCAINLIVFYLQAGAVTAYSVYITFVDTARIVDSVVENLVAIGFQPEWIGYADTAVSRIVHMAILNCCIGAVYASYKPS